MKKCRNCFEEIKNELEVCPFCGYVDGACSDVENSIALGAILSERYQLGKVIESDNSSITYLAWDKNSDMKVSIKEFCPKDLVNRKSNSSELSIKEGKKSLFDKGFKEFVEEAKRLYAGNGSVKLYDCIAVNNTAYMIFEAPNPTDEFNPFKSVKNDDIDSNSSIDSSNDINVIKTGDKNRYLKQLINSIPLWAKIAAPVLIGVVIVISILSKVGLFTSNNDADEMVSETAVTETTVESTNTVVDAEVLVLDGNSYACYSGYETWEDARDYCESLGGHLAVISSQRENDALYRFSLVYGYDNVYIGYSDAGHEGDWQWVNGEESAYTNWNTGEPNGFTQLENYAVMSKDGKWFDADYAPRYEGGMVSFICEWDNEVSGASIVQYSDLLRLIESYDDFNSADSENEESESAVIADGDYCASSYTFSDDGLSGLFHIREFVSCSSDYIESLDVGDALLNGEIVESIFDQHYNGWSFGYSGHGSYYMFDAAEVAYMIDIGEYSIPVSPDVVIMDYANPFSQDGIEIYNDTYYIDDIESLRSIVSDENAWCTPDLFIRITNGEITTIITNPWNHQPWREIEPSVTESSPEVVATQLTIEQAAQAFENYFNEQYSNTGVPEDVSCYWWQGEQTGETVEFGIRSYTGAITNYYINLNSGSVSWNSYVPSVPDSEVSGDNAFNAWDYLY